VVAPYLQRKAESPIIAEFAAMRVINVRQGLPGQGVCLICRRDAYSGDTVQTTIEIVNYYQRRHAAAAQRSHRKRRLASTEAARVKSRCSVSISEFLTNQANVKVPILFVHHLFFPAPAVVVVTGHIHLQIGLQFLGAGSYSGVKFRPSWVHRFSAKVGGTSPKSGRP
jgi:hypothetical protein